MVRSDAISDSLRPRSGSLRVIGTTIDGNPTNNFLKRDVTYNPNEALKGACGVTIVGTYAYVCCDAGLAVISIEKPAPPELKTILPIKKPCSVQVQFRYAFVCGEEGITSLDITNLAKPV